MQPLHCMKWGDMDPTLRQMMREKCLELLGLPPETITVLTPEPKAEEPKATKAPRLAWWRRA